MTSVFWTYREVSRELAIGETTLKRMVRDGTIPSCKIEGMRRFHVPTILRWAQERAGGDSNAATTEREEPETMQPVA